MHAGPSDDPYLMRAFAFQGGNGARFMVMLNADGSANLMTPYRPSVAPTVGDAWKVWNLQIGTSATSTEALAGNGFAVTAIDAARPAP